MHRTIFSSIFRAFFVFWHFFQFFPIFFILNSFDCLERPKKVWMIFESICMVIRIYFVDTLFVAGSFVLACLLSICWLNGRIMGFKFWFPLHCIALRLFRQIKWNYCFVPILNSEVEIYQMKIAEICDEDTARLAVWLLIGLVWHSNFSRICVKWSRLYSVSFGFISCMLDMHTHNIRVVEF